MAQSVTPFGLPVKGPQPLRRNPVHVLRECMSTHGVTVEDLASRWGVSRTVAQRIVAGERPIAWDRLRSLPRAVAADWCARWGASIEGRPTRHVEGEALDVTAAVGALSQLVIDAVRDGVTADEAAAVTAQIARARLELDDLQVAVEKAARR